MLLGLSCTNLQAQMKLNEILIQPSTNNTLVECTGATNSFEYIELFNSSKCDTIDLSCYILGFNISGTNNGAFAFPAGSKLAPLDFIVVGGDGVAPTVDFDLDLVCSGNRYCGTPTLGIPDTTGWVALYDGNASVVDAVFWTAQPGQPTELVSNPAFQGAPCVPASCSNVGALKAANQMVAGLEIQYAGQAPIPDSVIYRSTDGVGNWLTNGTPSPNACNGVCVPPSDLSLVFDSVINERCLLSNGEIYLEATGGVAPYRYEWQDQDNDPFRTGLTAGLYAVTVFDDEGCQFSISDSLLNIGAPIDATIDPSAATIFEGDAIQLEIITANNNQLVSTVWDTTTGLSCTDCPDPIARPRATITYTVDVVDEDGCIGSASSAIKVLKDENSVFIATAFTPNGDGKNDILFVRSPRIASLDFRLYDRWGQELFATQDVTVGWDGKDKAGKDANVGVYVYMLEVVLTNGESRTIKGNVTLLR